jgi:tetratricopeptide (TPR) repeat protein
VHATLAVLLALTLVQTAYWADDATLYARIIAVNPLSSMAYSNLGRTLEEHGQYDAAVASYREALRLDPGNEAALVNVGNVLYKKGDYEGVIAHYSALLAAVPPTDTAARMHNNLGAAYLKTERYEDGIAEFRQAIAIDPAYLEPYYNLGITLMALGRPAEAVPVLQQGVAIDPAHAALRNQLDAALAQAGSR